MRRFFLIFYLIVVSSQAEAQTSEQVSEAALKFLQKGDYSNAVMVLNRGLQKSPDDLILNRDLAYTYYLQRDYANALKYISPLLDREDADVKTYQIGGNIYKALEEVKACDKMYVKALKKYPTSGALYSEYGELLWARKEGANAIANWEKGISTDPTWPSNYYHAAKYYYARADKVWSLIYGEIFINMESYSERSGETKLLLLESYKKFYTTADVFKDYEAAKKSGFENAVISTLKKYDSEAAGGITPSSLTAIRTRFVTDWFQTYGKQYPLRLFDQWQYLVREGMFDAYNQWIFGPAANLPEYQLWVKANDKAVADFTYYQRNRVFKMPAGQYYGNQK
ncbi:hypothetical protein [Pollutibacter soli]|uniref:tetratricopeptide repeat protein n=1 Tax=Pollutibacter soli TaxID=3034157 RepID=UPI0030133F8C